MALKRLYSLILTHLLYDNRLNRINDVYHSDGLLAISGDPISISSSTCSFSPSGDSILDPRTLSVNDCILLTELVKSRDPVIPP